MKANEIKRGTVFQSGKQNIIVKQVQVQSPSSRSGNTLYKVRGYDIASRQKFENSFKGEENVNAVDVSRLAIQYLYRDGDAVTFMETESYEQHTIGDELIADEMPFIAEGLAGLTAIIADGILLGIELPASVALEITECAPAMKSASSSARTKPATLTTGLVVQVPEYLTPGEMIKVNTETREFMSRA
jgi:elongation factor P